MTAKVHKLPVPPRRGTGVTQFKPEEALEREAQANAVKEYARNVKDWNTLKDAVKQQIADQRLLVEWWEAKVTPRLSNVGGKASADPGTLSMRDAQTLTGFKNQKISKFRKGIERGEKYEVQLFGPSYAEAMGLKKPRGTEGTGENEWYTPDEHLELVRQVLGEIDLDPASSAKAQKRVQAKKFFTKKDDGLTKDWTGNVFLNPPYTQPDIAHFAAKMIEEVEVKRIEQAIMLTHNYTDTEWFQSLAKVADAICFTAGRIKFESPSSEKAAPTQGQAFFYFGNNVSKFVSVFAEVGFVVKML